MDQSDEGANPKGFKPEDIEYALDYEQMHAYLRHVRPDGYSCPVCTQKKWGVAEFFFPDGKYRSLPTTLTVKQYTELPAIARMLYGSAGVYNFVCANCGHVLGFHAGYVATRTALWARDKK